MAYFFHAGRCKNLEPRKKFTFPKKNRIKSKAGFQLVYTTGRSVVDSLSVLYVLPLDAEGPKIGFAVGKKIGNAVVRNRVKRMMREVFRENIDDCLYPFLSVIYFTVISAYMQVLSYMLSVRH